MIPAENGKDERAIIQQIVKQKQRKYKINIEPPFNINK